MQTRLRVRTHSPVHPGSVEQVANTAAMCRCGARGNTDGQPILARHVFKRRASPQLRSLQPCVSKQRPYAYYDRVIAWQRRREVRGGGHTLLLIRLVAHPLQPAVATPSLTAHCCVASPRQAIHDEHTTIRLARALVARHSAISTASPHPKGCSTARAPLNMKSTDLSIKSAALSGSACRSGADQQALSRLQCRGAAGGASNSGLCTCGQRHTSISLAPSPAVSGPRAGQW